MMNKTMKQTNADLKGYFGLWPSVWDYINLNWNVQRYRINDACEYIGVHISTMLFRSMFENQSIH